jgi:branched-chain amino acid transport system substrate-binding protein
VNALKEQKGVGMKRYKCLSVLLSLVVLAALVVALAGCGEEEGGGDDQASEGPIVIGCAMGLTGFMVTWDVPVYTAAQLAVEDINAAGGVLGRQLQLVEADTKSDFAIGPQAASQCLEQGAEMLIVSTDFDAGSPAALVGQSEGAVCFSAAVSPMFGVQGVGDLAFSCSDSATEEAAAGAQWCYEQGFRNVYVLVDETVAAERDYGKYFGKSFTHLGGAVVGEDVFKNDDQSIAAQITHFKSLSPAPDLICLASYAPGGPAALRQIRAAGIDVPVIGADDWDGIFWLEAVPGVKDVYGCTTGAMFGDDPNEQVNELFDRMREKLGKEIDSALALGGYTAIQCYAAAVEKAGTTEGKAVAAALESMTVETVTGPVSYTETDHIIYDRSITIIGFWDNNGHFVARLTPDYTPEYEFGID